MGASAKASSGLTLTMHSDREIIMTRVFAAPRRLVFQAWSSPEHMLRWYGPRSCPLVACEMDFRVGGSWRNVMRFPDGKEMVMRGVYQEIKAPERLVSTESFDDYPGESLNTITLTEENGQTTFTCHVLYQSKEIRDAVIRSGMEGGAGETYDRLAEHVAGLQRAETAPPELTLTRVFNAPRELVFQAWTDPRRLQRWWGPKGFSNPVCEVDPRPGGAIRIHMRAPNGIVYPMTGTFLEIVEPERLVFKTSPLDNNGEPLFEVLNTVTFADDAGNTRLTLHATVSNIKPEAMLHIAGMEQGWNQTLDRLGEEVSG